MMPPVPYSPCTSAPPRTCTATPPSFSRCSPSTGGPSPSTAIASTFSSAMTCTGASPNNCGVPKTPPTSERANAFLPEFLADLNPRFTRPPSDPAPAWRAAPHELPLVLSCRYSRQVARDNTVRLGPRWIQLPPGPHRRSYARCRVELRELLDGRLVVLHEGAILATQPAPLDFVLKPHSAPGAERHRPARLHPTQNAPGLDPAALPPAPDQRGATPPR